MVPSFTPLFPSTEFDVLAIAVRVRLKPVTVYRTCGISVELTRRGVECSSDVVSLDIITSIARAKFKFRQ